MEENGAGQRRSGDFNEDEFGASAFRSVLYKEQEIGGQKAERAKSGALS